MKTLRKIVYENHIDLYQQRFYSPLDSFEYELLANSREYKIGCMLLNPIRKILKYIGV